MVAIGLCILVNALRPIPDWWYTQFIGLHTSLNKPPSPQKNNKKPHSPPTRTWFQKALPENQSFIFSFPMNVWLMFVGLVYLSWCCSRKLKERLSASSVQLVHYPLQVNTLVVLPQDFSELINQVSTFTWVPSPIHVTTLPHPVMESSDLVSWPVCPAASVNTSTRPMMLKFHMLVSTSGDA